MTCLKCGTNNIDGSTFCIKCGTKLNTFSHLNTNNELLQKNLNNEQSVGQQSIEQPQVNYSQPISNQSAFNQVLDEQQLTNISKPQFNYLMFIIALFLKPYRCFKEEEEKLNDTKTSIILCLIVAFSMVLIQLIRAILDSIFPNTLDSSTLNYKTTLDLGGLKNLDWGNLLGKNLLLYIGIIVGIALVYYIVSLIFKKNTNFIKMLSISTTSLVPFVLLGMVVSPILGKIWFPLSIFSGIAGGVYSLFILINLIDDNIKFDVIDIKIYFHLICFTILSGAGYYLYMKLLESSITNNLYDLLSFFK